MAAGVQALPLPVLRPDVEFFAGPDDPDGAPTFVLHDPLRGTFERATWVQAEVLSRLRQPRAMGPLLAELARNTTIKVTAEDVQGLCADVRRRGLTLDTQIALEEPGAAGASVGRRGLAGLFRHLVFARIPLLRPDEFLSRTVTWVRPLGSRPAFVLYALIAVLGLVALAQRFDAYLATLPYFFNPAGALAFALAVVAVKVLHEFSHAYVAKAMGNRVPTMGVVLIFLFPVAYADVTDSWRMRHRRRRALISLAGVTAELVVAGAALLAWAISPPGLVRSLAFTLSSATLLTTILLNLNPAMRRDGYYLLSDLLGIDNLQSRAFAATRWLLYRHLLGLPVAAPEPGLRPGRMAILASYTAVAWVYRLIVYVGIALMLYHRVTKVVGAILFALAIYTFLLRPVAMEVFGVFRLRRVLSWNWRTATAAAACASLAFWLAWPLPRWQAVPAVTAARESQVVYAPGEGVIRELLVRPQSWVNNGQTLLVIASPELEAQADLARLEVERLGLELAIVKTDERRRALLPQKLEELARAQARLEGLEKALERNCLRAGLDGVVVEWNEALHVGSAVGTRQVLGRIVNPDQPGATAYVPDRLAHDVRIGQQVYFCADAPPGRQVGRVSFVDSVPTVIMDHLALASVAGGPIAVSPDAAGHLRVLDSYYRIEVALEEPADFRLGQTGRLWLRAAARSRLAELLRHLHRVLLRESSL